MGETVFWNVIQGLLGIGLAVGIIKLVGYIIGSLIGKASSRKD